MASQKFLIDNVFLLRMAKLYKLDQSQSVVRKICDHLMRIASVCLVTGFIVGLIAEIINQGAFEFTSNGMSYAHLGSSINAMQRVLYYYLYEDETADLVKTMNTFFKVKTQTLLEEKTIERTIYISKILTFLWPSFAVSYLFLFSVLKFIFSSDRVLIISVALPYDWTPSPFYEITYFTLLILFLVLVYIEGSTDVFFFASVLLTAEQYKLLGWEFKNLLYTTLVANGMPKHRVLKFSEQFNKDSHFGSIGDSDFNYDDIFEMCETEKFKKDMLRNMNRLIEFHQSLASFSANLDDFFSWPMLTFYLVMGFTSLFMNFLMISSRDVSFMVILAPVIVGVLFEIFFPCLVSVILSTEAENLQSNVYEMPWYLCSKECRTNLKILLHKLNMPITLTMGKFFVLNLNLFLFIVKTLNSYCIVLYQLTQPE